MEKMDLKDAETPKYSNLKLDYFDLLDNAKEAKGHIRAFIGIKTWLYESEYNQINDGVKAHIKSLHAAIEDLRKSISCGSFTNELSKLLDVWYSEGHSIKPNSSLPVLSKPPIPKIKDWEINGLSTISLFSGAFGLDLGFMAAGFNINFATDIDKSSLEVAERNIPKTPFVLGDFSEISSDEVLRKAGLKKGEVDVLVGGPPCQPFSTAGKREGFNDPRSSPLKEFIRAIKDLKPRAFVMEEVTGLLSSRLKHVPISERHNRSLKDEEEKGSAFAVVLDMLKSTNYNFIVKTLDAADFGAPQSRKRVIIIGLRDKEPSHLLPEYSRKHPDLFSNYRPQITFWEATADLLGREQSFVPVSDETKQLMALVPPGGHWRHLPENLIEGAMGGAYRSGGGKMGFFRRLSWDDVSPTVVTSPIQKGSLLYHPYENRAISVEEYGRIQGFPDDWSLPGSTSTKYKLIGNAVPVQLSYAIAKHIRKLLL